MPPEGIFRLPVQRSFLLEGHGTVVTGVPLAGRVSVGQTLEVVPGERRCRVRAIQAYHREVQEGRAGHRTALKLSDVSWKEVRRGNVVAEPGFLEEMNLVEGRFACLARRPRGVVSNMPVRLHVGTALGAEASRAAPADAEPDHENTPSGEFQGGPPT